MLKLIGAGLVLLSSTLCGFQLAKRLSDRTLLLREIQMALQLLETEICYGSTPLQVAFQKVSVMDLGLISKMFGRCGQYFDELDGATTYECWEKTMHTYTPKLALKKAELEWLQHFGQIIGNSDRDDQRKHLQLMMAQFKKSETEARDDELKYEKMYKTLGFLAGALIVILML
ncbi:stage III sporulation protein SpoIIIAB [Caldalkalibacillus salinus]|uniref:stage III sporulation protein SpoIIIAB n=1 Tax=Caldalkalibacillus salinus TaxID=2803787 RepID=UPI001921682A|nr:stage III sporulation protein SpoIIIAB [Caldalkalibacillus salinus]